MTLRLKIEQDLKSSMLAKDALKTSALRMMKSSIKNKEIDLQHELKDEEIIALLMTLKKQREDSITQYSQGNRPDLVEKEQAELAIIQAYLPTPLTEAEVDLLIQSAIQELGAATIKDMGKTVKWVLDKTAGRADGKVVSEKIKKLLS